MGHHSNTAVTRKCLLCRAMPGGGGKANQLPRSRDALSIQERAQQSIQDTAKRLKVIEVRILPQSLLAISSCNNSCCV